MGFAADHGIRALCFDIDGTFYPQSQTHHYLFRSFWAHPVFSCKYNKMRQLMRQQDGLEAGPVMNLSEFRAKECRIMYGHQLPSYEEHYRKYLFDSWQRTSLLIKPYPHVRESIEEAGRRGYKLGVLSDFPIGNKLKTLGLEGLFDFEASSEDFGYLKPNGRPFIEMLRAMGVSPEEALYVGDSERKDVKGAAAAGMHTLLINAKEKKASQSSADLVLTGWDKFINIVL